MSYLLRQQIQAKAAAFLAELPQNIRAIVELLPFGPRYALASALHLARIEPTDYHRGIAVGQIIAAEVREEISPAHMETLALYAGNL